jgi:hypothetical protein
MEAVDGFGEDTGGTGLAYAPGAAEKIGVCQLAPKYRILEGPGYVVLSYQGLERVRTILPSRNDILTHKITKIIK